jgi:hypothetical protein
MGTTKVPTVKIESEEEDMNKDELPEEYEEEEEPSNPLYWKGNVRVDTIVYPPVTADLLVHEKDSVILSHIDLHLPQGQVLLNDTLNMIVS